MALNGFTRINSTNTPFKVMQAYNHSNQLLKQVKKQKKMLTTSSKATFSNYGIKWLYTQTLPMPQPKSCKLLKQVKNKMLSVLHPKLPFQILFDKKKIITQNFFKEYVVGDMFNKTKTNKKK